MRDRIAIPLLAVSLFATPAFALEPSPKPPVASPALIAGSPKMIATPAQLASPKATATPVRHTRVDQDGKLTAPARRHALDRHAHVATTGKTAGMRKTVAPAAKPKTAEPVAKKAVPDTHNETAKPEAVTK